MSPLHQRGRPACLSEQHMFGGAVVVVVVGVSFSLALSHSVVEECETRGETSLTDGRTLTQFAEWVRDGGGGREVWVVHGAWRGVGGGATCVFSGPCAQHMSVLTLEIPRIFLNKCLD